MRGYPCVSHWHGLNEFGICYTIPFSSDLHQKTNSMNHRNRLSGHKIGVDDYSPEKPGEALASLLDVGVKIVETGVDVSQATMAIGGVVRLGDNLVNTNKGFC